jgi:DNA-directed RNA polymerase subunit RPC12/RpoP
VAPAFLSRFRRGAGSATDGATTNGSASAPAGQGPAAARRRPLPPAGRLRRDRRALIRVREQRVRDLGGLVLEMVRRDAFREDLVYEQCSELMGIEERIQELDALLATATAVRRTRPSARCSCGAPILWGSYFCANCGRAVAAGGKAVTCPSCSAQVAADAMFCASCGYRVGGQGQAPDVSAEDEAAGAK